MKKKFATPAVFAVVEHGPFRNTKDGRCALTGSPIRKGEPSYMVRFNSYNDGGRYYVSDEGARTDAGFRQSVAMHDQWMYPAQLMFYGDEHEPASFYRYLLVDREWGREKYELWQRREWLQRGLRLPDVMEILTRKFGLSVEDVRKELASPPVMQRQPLSVDVLWDRLWQSIQELTLPPAIERHDKRSPWKLLGTVIMCDLHPRLITHFAELAPELQVVLACSDNSKFQRLAMECGLLPGWDLIRERLDKSRLDLDDMFALAEWGVANPQSLELLSRANEMLGILSFSEGGPLGFRMLANGHSAHLLYLFSGRADLCPILTYFAPEAPKFSDKIYESDRSLRFIAMMAYQLPYLYRTKVMEALLSDDTVRAEFVMDRMREHVKYYIHGSPKSYISMTAKLIAQYSKRCARRK